MCGIAGFICRDREQVQRAAVLMTDALSHRGPDQHGLEVQPFGSLWVGLGHRRLSIQDLSEHGRQPMLHEPTGCRIIYNGEVYNFPALRKELEKQGERFKSGSDTEVILAGIAREGPSYIKKLEGMYAFAFYDPRIPVLILARDPAGIKPLFIAEKDGCFLFSSEVRSILSSGIIPRKISREAVGGLLAYGSVQQPLSIIESVRMMPPGAWQIIRLSGEHIQSDSPNVWWSPPKPTSTISVPEAFQQTRSHLESAVRDHLISDVPVGVFLSAGVDSTILAGLATQYNRDVRTFTVGFSEHPEFDEIANAEETARRLNLSHTPIRIPVLEAEAAAADWFAMADQPSMDGLNTFVISKAVREKGIKVALSGLGGDELFGGYPSFRDVPRLRTILKAVGWLPMSARRGVARMLAVTKSSLIRQKLMDMLGVAGSTALLTLMRRRVLNDQQLGDLGLDSTLCGITKSWLPEAAEAWLPNDPSDIGWAISVAESRFYQTNVLLRDSDANGMAHALEIRVPFLDQRLLNFAHSLPGTLRFPTDMPSKYLLRQAHQEILHADLLKRPKSGFTLPLRRWMIGPLRPLCETGLKTLKESGLVHPAGVDAVWNAFLANPESQIWSRVLTLVALGDYMDRHQLVIS